jgi:Rrf2 family protein
MVQMARHEQRGPLTINDIAKSEKLTPAYVGKLMRVLRRGGLVDAQHGPTGGYRLPRPAVEMNLGEILSVLGGRLFEPRYCEKFGGEQAHCVHTNECSVRSLWSGLDQIVDHVLRRTSLADLIQAERSMTSWISDMEPAAVGAVARPSGAARQPRPTVAAKNGGPS